MSWIKEISDLFKKETKKSLTKFLIKMRTSRKNSSTMLELNLRLESGLRCAVSTLDKESLLQILSM